MIKDKKFKSNFSALFTFQNTLFMPIGKRVWKGYFERFFLEREEQVEDKRQYKQTFLTKKDLSSEMQEEGGKLGVERRALVEGKKDREFFGLLWRPMKGTSESGDCGQLVKPMTVPQSQITKKTPSPSPTATLDFAMELNFVNVL